MKQLIPEIAQETFKLEKAPQTCLVEKKSSNHQENPQFPSLSISLSLQLSAQCRSGVYLTI